MRIVLVVLLSLLAFPFSDARAETCPVWGNDAVKVRNGMMDGMMLSRMSSREMEVYMIGFVNGLSMSTMFGASSDCANSFFDRCVASRSAGQLAAMLRKFLDDNPARWHENGNGLAWGAIYQGCNK